MASKLLCDECGKKYPPAEKKVLFPASEYEPAEYGRILKGIAKKPTQQQRTIYLNDKPYQMDPSVYTCDFCGNDIKPGDKVTCLTIWTDNRPEPAPWEGDYLK